jgi:hypothetical protein
MTHDVQHPTKARQPLFHGPAGSAMVDPSRSGAAGFVIWGLTTSSATSGVPWAAATDATVSLHGMGSTPVIQ